MNKVFIEKYIHEMEDSLKVYGYSKGSDSDVIYSTLRRCIKVIGKDINVDESAFLWRSDSASEDARTLIDILEYQLSKIETEEDNTNILAEKPIIFISHKSDDKKYGHALRNFLIGLGIKNEQLIYTSHELHKIPFGKNIYEYLRTNIHSNVFMIILWSDKYLESPACLNEMGAAWVVQSDYTNIYTPTFHFGNPKYRECAVDTNKMGAVLNGDGHCKTSMIELKDKVQALFGLDNDEKTTSYLLDQFMNEIRNNEEDSNIVPFQ